MPFYIPTQRVQLSDFLFIYLKNINQKKYKDKALEYLRGFQTCNWFALFPFSFQDIQV